MASVILDDVKAAIRVKADSANQEIEDLIAACKKEMEIAGVYIQDETDGLAKQAIKLYCKAHYGYDEKTVQFQMAYEALRDAMALSGEYVKQEESDGSEVNLE